MYYRKPRTRRAKRALEKREPKVFENVKKAMFVRGPNTSPAVRDILKELVGNPNLFLFSHSLEHLTLSLMQMHLNTFAANNLYKYCPRLKKLAADCYKKLTSSQKYRIAMINEGIVCETAIPSFLTMFSKVICRRGIRKRLCGKGLEKKESVHGELF